MSEDFYKRTYLEYILCFFRKYHSITNSYDQFFLNVIFYFFYLIDEKT